MLGGCLCGAVRFEYEGSLGGDLGMVTLCRCGQCRKVHGYGAAVAPALAAGFTVTAGSDEIREYESSPGKRRAFCAACGSPLYSRRDSVPAVLRLRVSALDEAPQDLRIEALIYTAEMPAWTALEDVPSFPGQEPGRGLAPGASRV